MTSVRCQVSSYDTGARPRVHDEKRGKWQASADFYLASISHSFGCAYFGQLPFTFYSESSVFWLVPYVITLAVYGVPIFFIQAFLGQFSSSGYISVFRIAPLFKGIGYVILFFNVTVLTYYGVYVSLPLWYFLNSFQPTLPWMTCSNFFNSPNCTLTTDNSTEMDTLSSAEYYHKVLHVLEADEKDASFNISLVTLAGCVIVWILAQWCVRQGTEWLGTAVRYLSIFSLTTLVVVFLRFSFLPNSYDDLFGYFSFDWAKIGPEMWISAPFLSLTTLGIGWGAPLSLASHNHFKTDIHRLSWIVCLSQMGISVLAGLCCLMINTHVTETLFNGTERSLGYYGSHPAEAMYSSFSLGLGSIGWPNLWSALFFGMMFAAEFSTVVIQLFNISTALFDEFEELRELKAEVIQGLAGFFMVTSIYFSSNHGYSFFSMAWKYVTAMQVLICLLILLIVVWVYGRLRFQRDVQFMLKRTFPTWKVYMLRFVTPVIMTAVFFVLMVFYMFVDMLFPLPESLLLVTYLIKFLPWIVVPGYVAYCLSSTTGTILTRLKHCVRPTDWYPTDAADRHRYETSLGVSDISQQLVDMQFDLRDDME